jgi:predicted membrane chloride channel (bestrophin family)
MNDSLRKIWNDIVDTARDFSRMIKLYEIPIGTSRCRRINNLLASFPYLLRHRIRPSLMTFYRVNDSNVERDPEHSLLLYPDESLRDTDPEVAWLAYDEEETGSSRRNMRELCFVDRRTLPWKLIPEGSLASLSRAQNRPLWVCDRMAKELVVVEDMIPSFTNRERMALIGYVEKLSRSIGACERIHQTSVPLNYARHALRSLTVWLWTLPAVLVKDLGLLTGPAVAVLSWILFGVYEIGSRIEDPFQGTLRLSVYCDAIRRDVLADAIARDTAFILEDEEGKSSVDKRGGDDAIFELESESEEYDGDDVPPKKEKKKPQKSWTFPGL